MSILGKVLGQTVLFFTVDWKFKVTAIYTPFLRQHCSLYKTMVLVVGLDLSEIYL